MSSEQRTHLVYVCFLFGESCTKNFIPSFHKEVLIEKLWEDCMFVRLRRDIRASEGIYRLLGEKVLCEDTRAHCNGCMVDAGDRKVHKVSPFEISTTIRLSSLWQLPKGVYLGTECIYSVRWYILY